MLICVSSAILSSSTWRDAEGEEKKNPSLKENYRKGQLKMSLLVEKQATSFEVTGVTKFKKKCSLMWLRR